MNSTSPANSSVSTTAIIGGGGGSVSNVALDDFHFPSDSIQDRKDEAMLALKTDLMAALNKEVKSLDEDNWKFEGPRSRINLISRPGGFLSKKLLECNSCFDSKEKSVAAISRDSMVVDGSKHENARSIGSRGGICSLLEICQAGTPSSQGLASRVLRNLAVFDDIIENFIEDNVGFVLIGLAASGIALAQENKRAGVQPSYFVVGSGISR
ncbi:unnamed protein product [Dovyalis caffra]|uniref:Uncharacterized protein n=1 Tax=Dovyalis caffra TaxID=77055 RepID=A0AAV1SQN0_9ROSI|nr:unnamed protein product [Dovyalis caffra]